MQTYKNERETGRLAALDHLGAVRPEVPICRELAERMGGKISIRSRIGVGTSVKIELPEAEVTDG